MPNARSAYIPQFNVPPSALPSHPSSTRRADIRFRVLENPRQTMSNLNRVKYPRSYIYPLRVRLCFRVLIRLRPLLKKQKRRFIHRGRGFLIHAQQAVGHDSIMRVDENTSSYNNVKSTSCCQKRSITHLEPKP
jgi:hypothetical protein